MSSGRLDENRKHGTMPRPILPDFRGDSLRLAGSPGIR
jgi:hypothetical protein